MNNDFIAHRTEDGKEQSAKEHAENVARRSRESAIPLLAEAAYCTGLLHDIGKYSAAFQKYIRGEGAGVEHAACGAQEARRLFMGHPMLMLLAAYVIAGHHSGLPDGGTGSDHWNDTTLRARLERDVADFSLYREELKVPEPDMVEFQNYFTKFSTTPVDDVELFAFFTKYLYSCLTDADFLDTEQVFSPGTNRGLRGDFDFAAAALEQKLAGFPNKTAVQKARQNLQAQALANCGKAEVSLLNMPTGSGKTLTSLRVALERLKNGEKKRIIYVIPYTSIIEQTAEEFEKIFGDKLPVLQHHSNFDFEKSDPNKDKREETTEEKLKRACENWDAKFIITTNIQFFESLYHYKSSRLRKLHHLADSILVFDEIHMLPIQYLQPCLRAVAYLTKHLNSEAIFLSATMPDYEMFLRKYMPHTTIESLIDDPSPYQDFPKYSYHYLGEQTEEQILERASGYRTRLIVVNSRAAARKLYQLCGGNKYHLSTYQTPADRSELIKQIRADLDPASKKEVTVISTSLIEAGVDLDFDVAFRETAGVDNILQTAGRCNREGLQDKGDIFIFDLEGQGTKNSELQIRANLARNMLKEYGDLRQKDCVKDYYDRLFDFYREEIEANSIAGFGGTPVKVDAIPFRSYAEHFHMIDSSTINVVIPTKESEPFIEELRKGKLSVKRKLQRYSASVRIFEWEEMNSLKLLEEVGGVFVLKNGDYYDKETGLNVQKAINYCVGGE